MLQSTESTKSCFNHNAGIHPHELNMIVIVKLKPVKVPMPVTKREGRKEVRPCLIIVLTDHVLLPEVGNDT
jgi:hypothetical protein